MNPGDLEHKNSLKTLKGEVKTKRGQYATHTWNYMRLWKTHGTPSGSHTAVIRISNVFIARTQIRKAIWNDRDWPRTLTASGCTHKQIFFAQYSEVPFPSFKPRFCFKNMLCKIIWATQYSAYFDCAKQNPKFGCHRNLKCLFQPSNQRNSVSKMTVIACFHGCNCNAFFDDWGLTNAPVRWVTFFWHCFLQGVHGKVFHLASFQQRRNNKA